MQRLTINIGLPVLRPDPYNAQALREKSLQNMPKPKPNNNNNNNTAQPLNIFSAMKSKSVVKLVC
jgi:hypothetical protein